MRLRHVLLIALLLALWNVWAYDLWAPDEPYFGEGAREMIADGQWLVPHVNGVVTTDKPPLFFWLIALVSWPFAHVSSLTARLPSILAYLGSVALVARLGGRLAANGRGKPRPYGEGANAVAGSGGAGALAALVFATAYLPWDKARSAQIDSLLCLLVLAAISAFEAFRAGTLDGRRAGVAVWALGGLATLAKGPVGFLLPVGVAFFTLLADRRLRDWRRFAPLLGPLAFVAVVALWAVPAMLLPQDYSLVGALETHFFNRALHGMHHKNPPYYYLGAIGLQFLPWSPLLPGALLLAWRRRRDPADRLLLVWVLFIVLFFTLSGERRDLYVLPAYPALALLVARFGSHVAAPGGERRVGAGWILWPQLALGVLFVAAAVLVPKIATKELPSLARPALTVAAVLVAAGLALAITALRRRPAAVLAATAAGMSLVYLAVATFVLPPLDATKSARAFSLAVRDRTAAYRAAGGKVMAFRTSNVPEAISFYAAVYTTEEGDENALERFLDGPQPAYAISDRHFVDELPAAVRAKLTVEARANLARMELVLVRGGAAGPANATP